MISTKKTREQLQILSLISTISHLDSRGIFVINIKCVAVVRAAGKISTGAVLRKDSATMKLSLTTIPRKTSMR